MKEAFEFWATLANDNSDESSTRFIANKEITQYDLNFILKFVTRKSKVLDLGSGTGLIINKLYKYVEHIPAVVRFSNFSQYIVHSDKIKIINATVEDFSIINNSFDLVTFFGMIQYLNEEETNTVYKKYYKSIKKGGKIIVKHQFGVTEDVLISCFSKELNRKYASHYRHIDKEVELLKNNSYKNIEIFDIYPPEYNRWTNTHFYAIVAEKK
jgi:cyclopropane fatty-acyl-phospholipid synthase-like methyltransferase